MFREEDIEYVLGNIRHRWPESTREDAINILRDSEVELANERRQERREDAERHAELNWMGAR